MGGEALAQVAQRSCGCPLPGSVQGRVGWSSEQPGLVEGVAAHGRGVGTFQPLLLYDSNLGAEQKCRCSKALWLLAAVDLAHLD